MNMAASLVGNVISLPARDIWIPASHCGPFEYHQPAFGMIETPVTNRQWRAYLELYTEQRFGGIL